MENKDSVSSNKLNLSDKSKKLNVKKIILVITVLAILSLMLLVLFNKHNVNKPVNDSYKGIDIYCESIYTESTLEGKEIHCDMVAKNNRDTTIYLSRTWGKAIAVKPGAEENFTLDYKYDIGELTHVNESDALTIYGSIDAYDEAPSSSTNIFSMQRNYEHRIYTLHYSIEHVGDTYTWKPLNT